MSNPLLQKYEEIHGKKEEPKPKPKSAQDVLKIDRNSIATLEALLEDLKSGRAVLTDCKTEREYNYVDRMSPANQFLYDRPFEYAPLPVHRGSQITLTIFRRHD